MTGDKLVGRVKPSLPTLLRQDMKRNVHVYIIVLPVVVYYFIFHYLPMYGALIAFKDFRPSLGVWGSSWAGLKHFREFFSSYYFARLLKNTLALSLYSLIFGFPAPIILALLLNELRSSLYKRIVQTITYIPHFISIVIISGIIINFVKQDGFISLVVKQFTGYDGHLLMEPKFFRSIYVASGVWQSVGWSSIIYLATLAGIDVELYEAARIDGAGRWRQTLAITIPSLLPTIIILLIIQLGSLMNVGFEKVMLLYNPRIYDTADVISTFVYRQGILSAQYSFSAAVGLFNSAINCFLVIMANQLSKRLTENSLW
ncbi:sugar ABC transporter permease [Spirochaetia bacterium]|nr:sugar ABC transporter permease [Spirochaetia bacterium]